MLKTRLGVIRLALASAITNVIKRNGSTAKFNKSKISNAIYKAMNACSKPDKQLADSLADQVIENLIKGGYSDKSVPGVENIQDTVEIVLLENKHSDIAKAYILYRQDRRKIRNEKMHILNTKTLDPVARKFDANCLRVLASRYLFRDSNSRIVESPQQLFERVAIQIGIGDMLYDPTLFDRDGAHTQNIEVAQQYLRKLDNFDNKFHIGKYYLNKWHFRSLITHYIYLARNNKMRVKFRDILELLASNKFDELENKITSYLEIMTSQKYLPNSPTMMNAGGRLGQLSACFVLDMKDDMEGIMKSTSDAALIFKSGGGVGINYSDLRHEGDTVASTFGVASGPVSFMNIINTVTEVVKQGGKRRGANMGILEVWHPDIEKFVSNKTKPGVLENFNVSVGIWEDFWDALLNSEDKKYTLRNPRDQTPVKEINAQQLIDQIALSAWKSAEPGLIFLDQINKYNVMAKARMTPLRATNPCGEQSLYPNESCNLGSINLANLVHKTEDGTYEFDWEDYERIIRQTTRFLDNVVDVNQYPVEQINEASKESRRIGLGVMGVADLLYKLRVPYNSEEGYALQSRLAEALSYFSMDESVELAKERGAFKLYPNTEYPEGRIPIAGHYECEDSMYDWSSLIKNITTYGIRNVLTTTVAPTGTLSMIADCSNGMEPNFALVYEKRVTIGKFMYVNKILKEALEEEGLYNDSILESIINNYGSLRGIDDIPGWMQDVFVTAMDIHWSDHLMAQAVWQRWISNAIAKTINMPYDVTVEDVKAAYLLAHEMGLKGITVYRDGSRQSQVMNMADDDAKKLFEVAPSKLMLKFVSEHTTDSYAGQRVRDALVPKIYNRETHINNVEVSEEMLCPTCKSHLIFAEGCSICVECGFSGCTSS